MLFTYEGMELELTSMRETNGHGKTNRVGCPVFYFKSGKMHMVLSYSDRRGWFVAYGCVITPELENNKLYQFLNRDFKTLAAEGEKLISYLFLKSPMRLRFLHEYGPLQNLL